MSIKQSARIIFAENDGDEFSDHKGFFTRDWAGGNPSSWNTEDTGNYTLQRYKSLPHQQAWIVDKNNKLTKVWERKHEGDFYICGNYKVYPNDVGGPCVVQDRFFAGSLNYNVSKQIVSTSRDKLMLVYYNGAPATAYSHFIRITKNGKDFYCLKNNENIGFWNIYSFDDDYIYYYNSTITDKRNQYGFSRIPYSLMDKKDYRTDETSFSIPDSIEVGEPEALSDYFNELRITNNIIAIYKYNTGIPPYEYDIQNRIYLYIKDRDGNDIYQYLRCASAGNYFLPGKGKDLFWIFTIVEFREVHYKIRLSKDGGYSWQDGTYEFVIPSTSIDWAQPGYEIYPWNGKYVLLELYYNPSRIFVSDDGINWTLAGVYTDQLPETLSYYLHNPVDPDRPHERSLEATLNMLRYKDNYYGTFGHPVHFSEDGHLIENEYELYRSGLGWNSEFDTAFTYSKTPPWEGIGEEDFLINLIPNTY